MADVFGRGVRLAVLAALAASALAAAAAPRTTVASGIPGTAAIAPARGSAPSVAQNVLHPVLQVRNAVTHASSDLVAGAVVKTFPYRPSRVYEIAIKPGMFTTFTFPKGEAIKQFAVSSPDMAEVAVNADTNTAMLRLKSPMSLSATIVTSGHAYYLSIVPSGGLWYQGVSWSYGGAGDFGYAASEQPGSASAADSESSDDGLSGQPNFDYSVSGDASIAPIAVWDDGRFTWLQFPRAVQSLPALFVLTADGPQIVNYVVEPGGRQIKVNRLMSRMLLRLGSSRAIVAAR